MEWLKPVLDLAQWRANIDRQSRTELNHSRATALHGLLDLMAALEIRVRSREIHRWEIERDLRSISGYCISNKPWMESGHLRATREWSESIMFIDDAMMHITVDELTNFKNTWPPVSPDEVKRHFKRMQAAEASLIAALRRAMRKSGTGTDSATP